jgi:predicted nucleic acid-binding protein
VTRVVLDTNVLVAWAVLGAALDGGADHIVSGDDDLFSLGSFPEIPILTPAAFLATRSR